MNLPLDDDQRAALVELLSDTIAADRFPLSPRIKHLRGILAKLEPPKLAVEAMPPPKPAGEPSMALRKRRSISRRCG